MATRLKLVARPDMTDGGGGGLAAGGTAFALHHLYWARRLSY